MSKGQGKLLTKISSRYTTFFSELTLALTEMQIYFKIQQKPLNVITLGHTKNIFWMITITDEFLLMLSEQDICNVIT